MTDDELKALVASLAVAQKVTDEQMKLTDQQMKHTDEQMRHTDREIASLRESQKETYKQIDKALERSAAQLEKSGRRIDRLAELYGNVSQNQEDVAEEFFLNSLLKDNHLGAIRFDDVTKNMEKHRGQIQEEYDLVMTNGDAIGIVEVKYKAHTNNLDKLDRKMRHFKKLFPIYHAMLNFK
ncbi:MAG: hypothetical protein ACNA7G_14135 [Methylobacter sp.]